MSNADKAMGIALGSVGISALIFVGAICVPVIIKDKNQTKDSLEKLNSKVEKDLDVDSFSTQNIIFDKTNENYLVKITGSSSEASYLAANYKVSEQDFYNVKPESSDFVKTKDSRSAFLENVLDILYRSEFLGKDAEDLALINNGEIVLNVSKPYANANTNSMNYNLTIAKLQGNDLKLGTFAVSTPLTETLKENPKEIYAMPSEKVEVEKLEVKTYKNVAHVEMYDNSTLII